MPHASIALPIALRMADLPSSPSAEVIVRAIESASTVCRRSQFFVWSQNQLDALLPHQVAVCGAYQRTRKELDFDVFYSLALPSTLLASLADEQSPLLRRVVALWLASQGRGTVINLRAARPADRGCFDDLLQAGYEQLLVHGVTRPQRPVELESIFIFTAQGTPWAEQHTVFLDMLLPTLHSTYLRVRATEAELAGRRAAAPVVSLNKRTSPITDRERQILQWVREGLSNPQIGAQLSISGLTVKNHVQKILRKLGAANRAQAVALAISQNLMDAAPVPPQE